MLGHSSESPVPLAQATALPARHYRDAEPLAMEKRAVFARSWQLVAHQGLLAEPGDHVVEQVGDVPVLIVRGADGLLRAFPNVCRHRAGPPAYCNGKGARALHCKYHGWSYSLEGQLRSAPEMQDAKDFDMSSIRLPPLQVKRPLAVRVPVPPKVPKRVSRLVSAAELKLASPLVIAVVPETL